MPHFPLNVEKMLKGHNFDPLTGQMLADLIIARFPAKRGPTKRRFPHSFPTLWNPSPLPARWAAEYSRYVFAVQPKRQKFVILYGI
jgi:hypothetical protein